ncbi:hypothetical protein HID58_010269 [Brassica napus]|uniref:Pentatricopeptide repeat-containing protein n=1 Tax=Brassica napus TaxID=3708 RepID=A0ABQ8DUS6_BRANA|nr:hypothetical protein HID58_010269 [Brassica napus]
MNRFESRLGPVVFNHLIRGLLDQDKLETAMDVFRQLKQRVVSSADDEIADLVHFIIDEDYNGIAMVTAIEYWFKQGNNEEAIKWNIISRFCEQGMMLSEAGAFFEDMCSKQFIIPTYRILLDAYANGSRFDDAERMANLTVDANLKCIAKFCPLD